MTYILDIEELGTLELEEYDQVIRAQQKAVFLGYATTMRYVPARSEGASAPRTQGNPRPRQE